VEKEDGEGEDGCLDIQVKDEARYTHGFCMVDDDLISSSLLFFQLLTRIKVDSTSSIGSWVGKIVFLQ
jgi:hypothetical protein